MFPLGVTSDGWLSAHYEVKDGFAPDWNPRHDVCLTLGGKRVTQSIFSGTCDSSTYNFAIRSSSVRTSNYFIRLAALLSNNDCPFPDFKSRAWSGQPQSFGSLHRCYTHVLVYGSKEYGCPKSEWCPATWLENMCKRSCFPTEMSPWRELDMNRGWSYK